MLILLRRTKSRSMRANNDAYNTNRVAGDNNIFKDVLIRNKNHNLC